MPTLTGRSLYRTYPGHSGKNDIAINSDNNVWVATGNPPLLLCLFNSANTLIDTVTTDLIPNATGVTVDTAGYLWVSDTHTNKIYKINLDPTGTARESSAEVTPFSARTAVNPFTDESVFLMEGSSLYHINIFDIRGRLVASGTTSSDSWVWNGSANDSPAPSGAYYAIVGSGSGQTLRLNLLKL